MCICILLSYQVCCFVTNVVKIIPSSECLFLCPFCICSAWERNGKRANSHRVYMYTFVLSESKRRVKPSADVRVVIPSKKKQRRLHRLHVVPCTFRIIRSALRRSPWLRDGSPVSPIPSRGLPRHHRFAEKEGACDTNSA